MSSALAVAETAELMGKWDDGGDAARRTVSVAATKPTKDDGCDIAWSIRDRRVCEQYAAAQENRTLESMPLPELALGGGVFLREVRGSRPVSVRLEKSGCYTAHFVPAVDVPISAYSRADLASAVQDVVTGLWKRYANAPDEMLWPDAQELKRRLLKHYEEHGG